MKPSWQTVMDNLSKIDRTRLLSRFVPFLFIKDQIRSTESSPFLLEIPLQFNRPGLSGHTAENLMSLSNANVINVPYGDHGNQIEVPLILAVHKYPSDILIEVQFGDGTLCGWFPEKFETFK